MENYGLQNERVQSFDGRRDTRKRFDEFQQVVAVCRTLDSDFEAPIQDVSSLLTGQEIAMTFMFPKTRKPIMATGEIVRVSYRGVGVKFKIFFKH
jgi:hypothetical protein